MLDFSQVANWQADALKSLENALNRKRLPHAMVLISPGDVGEKEIAEALATRLVCENPKEGLSACGECPSCHLRAIGTHPDVYYVRPEGRMRAISQDSMGQMMQALQTKSLKGQAKVVIIEQAEALTKESANKFLKTLEEPSSRTYFILQTRRGERLLPTIRSRCQTLRLRPLSENELLKIGKEELALSEEDALFVARLSRGRRDRALELASGLAAYKNDVREVLEIYEMRENSLQAARNFSQAKFRLMRDIREQCDTEISKAKKKLSEELKDADPNVRKVELQKLEEAMTIANAEMLQDMRSSIYEMLLSIWRDLWILRNGVSEEALLHSFAAPQLQRLAKLYNEDEIFRNIAEIELVRGPAVYLTMQFDIVMQGLLASHTAPPSHESPLRGAIRAVGL